MDNFTEIERERERHFLTHTNGSQTTALSVGQGHWPVTWHSIRPCTGPLRLQGQVSMTRLARTGSTQTRTSGTRLPALHHTPWGAHGRHA